MGTAALVFGPAILIGALLVFAVQPLIGKFILPWFGGGPGIWTTCILFFQALLLGGYFYAHVMVRFLPVRAQVAIHLVLLGVSLWTIPIIPRESFKPGPSDDPVRGILLLLCATIGLPYLMLSATSPLLQAWFVRVRPGVSPYRLFALSNVGSLVALLGYPFVIDPLLARRQQAWIWSWGLIAFTAICAACGIYVWKRRPQREPSASTEIQTPGGNVSMEQNPRERFIRPMLWLALPAISSILLLAVTNVITEDVASTPIFWIAPLALYLLTFIVAFDNPRWYPRRWMPVLIPLASFWAARIQWAQSSATLIEQFAGYLTLMFVIGLFCHAEVAKLIPPASELTAYYLCISLGGAIGGLFVAVVAPHLFNRLIELSLAVTAAGAAAMWCFRQTSGAAPPALSRWVGLTIAAGVIIFIAPIGKLKLESASSAQVLERSRNFYGTLSVIETQDPNPAESTRFLTHGTTSHGAQYLASERRMEPMLYYRMGSGVSYAMKFFPKPDHRRVGLVGLGVGTLAAYAQPGDVLRFYEINPEVERLARQDFTYLSQSKAEKVDVVIGDARLTLEREPDQGFDVLVLDAFSGDAIPTHLLTTEAFQVYQRHLAQGGILAVHFSNRAVWLHQVLLRQAERMEMASPVIYDGLSYWMLMTRNADFLNTPAVAKAGMSAPPDPSIEPWTDDHINLMSVIRWIPNPARSQTSTR